MTQMRRHTALLQGGPALPPSFRKPSWMTSPNLDGSKSVVSVSIPSALKNDPRLNAAFRSFSVDVVGKSPTCEHTAERIPASLPDIMLIRNVIEPMQCAMI